MKRPNLLLAAGLLGLQVAAFAQGTTATDSKPVMQSGKMATTPPAADATNTLKTDGAQKAAGATKAQPTAKSAMKSDAPVKTRAGMKTMSTDHAPATASGVQGKQPETPKS